MKRSEVVALIEGTIIKCKIMVNPEELTDADLSEEIMRTIEEVGMLPPDTGKGYNIVTVNPTGTHDYGISKDNRWEKE